MMRRLAAGTWIAILLVLMTAAIPPAAKAEKVAQLVTPWSAPVTISEPDAFNWFADVTIDRYGHVHVVWDGGLTSREKAENPGRITTMVMYSKEVEGVWSKPNDIVVIFDQEGNIFRAALTTDPDGNLYVLQKGSVQKSLTQPIDLSLPRWTEPVAVDGGAFYMGSLRATADGSIHALYDRLTGGSGGLVDPSAVADIYYVRSPDGGKTWTNPLNLSHSYTGEHREKLKVDAAGTLYATWDEGWDRLTEKGKPETGVLLLSRDNGATWFNSARFDYPEKSNAQFVATGDGRGGILAVWRATTRDEVFFSWSADGGVTWNAPQPIPRLLARPWETTRFDGYDLAVDGDGIFHLLAVGRLQLADQEKLYHLMWDGQAWTSPTAVYSGPGWPEWPRVEVSQGNRLHLVWFVRDRLETGEGSFYQIYYSRAVSSAAEQPLPTVAAVATAAPQQPLAASAAMTGDAMTNTAMTNTVTNTAAMNTAAVNTVTMNTAVTGTAVTNTATTNTATTNTATTSTATNTDLAHRLRSENDDLFLLLESSIPVLGFLLAVGVFMRYRSRASRE